MTEEIVYDWEFRFFAMRRSGHHAIIDWFRSLFDQSLHINDVNNAGLELDPLAQAAELRFVRQQCLIYSFEDPSLLVHASEQARQHRERAVGKSRRIFEVLVLRDPFNLFASRMRKGERLEDNQVDLWLEQAREFAGETSFLRNKLLINFNQWFANREFRQKLARIVERPFSDHGLERVPINGGGSSFDGLEFDGAAQKMNVLRRWQEYQNDLSFRRCFESAELWRLAEMIFGPLGTISLRPSGSSVMRA